MVKKKTAMLNKFKREQRIGKKGLSKGRQSRETAMKAKMQRKMKKM